jgi:hypothetical protein
VGSTAGGVGFLGTPQNESTGFYTNHITEHISPHFAVFGLKNA